MLKEKIIQPHWYKEKRTKEVRNCIRRFLIHCGLTYKQANRYRDWSDEHISKLLGALYETKN